MPRTPPESHRLVISPRRWSRGGLIAISITGRVEGRTQNGGGRYESVAPIVSGRRPPPFFAGWRREFDVWPCLAWNVVVSQGRRAEPSFGGRTSTSKGMADGGDVGVMRR